MGKIENGKNMTLAERGKAFWNKHKKKVYIIGGALVVFAGGYFVWKCISDSPNEQIDLVPDIESENLIQFFEDVVPEPVAEIEEIAEKEAKSFYRQGHIMKLTNGKKATQTALEYAAQAGVVVNNPDRETYRRGCMVNAAA